MTTHLLRFSVELTDCELEVEAPAGTDHGTLLPLVHQQLHLSTGNLNRELANHQTSLDPITCLSEYELVIKPIGQDGPR
jgi:hypothetical protein